MLLNLTEDVLDEVRKVRVFFKDEKVSHTARVCVGPICEDLNVAYPLLFIVAAFT